MTHLSALMAVALIALLVMSTASSLHDDSGLDDDINLHPVDFSLHEEDDQYSIESGEEESGNGQVEDLRATTKPRQCFEGRAITRMLCPWKPVRQMWTFNSNLKKCRMIKVDGCNKYHGDIFEKQSECIKTCAMMAPMRPIRTTKPPRRCATGATFSTQKYCGNTPDRKMWTYIEERNECVIRTVDGCNFYLGNIFKTKTECVRSCTPMN